MSATKLAKCIVSPQRVSSVLDWKRGACSILSLDIKKNGVGLALAGTANGENIIYALEPISMNYNDGSLNQSQGSNKKKYMEFKNYLTTKIEQTCQDNEVCAFIVNWPLKSDARFGKECGQVLHTLDHLVECPKSVIHTNRPFTLWDETEVQNSLLPDKWGRSELFSRVPEDLSSSNNKNNYIVMSSSSEKASQADSSIDSFIATHTLKSFLDYRYKSGNGEKYYCVDNPEDLVEEKKTDEDPPGNYYESKSYDSFLIDDYESNSSYIQPRLL